MPDTEPIATPVAGPTATKVEITEFRVDRKAGKAYLTVQQVSSDDLPVKRAYTYSEDVLTSFTGAEKTALKAVRDGMVARMKAAMPGEFPA